MTTEFLTRFADEEKLSEDERSIFDYIGVRSPEDVESLVKSFPSIVELGVRAHIVSNAAVLQMVDKTYAGIASSVRAKPPTAPLGAEAPPGAPTSPGSAVGKPPPTPFVPPTPASSIDLRLGAWPIRNQGQRKTCVSFATTACVEHSQHARGGGRAFSAQFLYWAIKTQTADRNK
jgi:hypothetical protein